MDTSVASIIIGVVVGVVSGIIASLVAWWILYYVLAPKIVFSDTIRKSKSENIKGGWKYQIAFFNSRPRDAVELRFRALLVIPDFPSAHSTTYQHINLSTNEILELKSAGKVGFNKRLYFKFNEKKNLIMYKQDRYPPRIRELGEQEAITPEALFAELPQAYIQITVTVSDATTGAKKLFRSKRYRAEDIIEGVYEPKSMTVKPIEECSNNAN
jgi:hypothetical protein